MSVIRLAGMSCADRFVGVLAQRVGDEALRIIGLPAGYAPEQCLQWLAQAVNRAGEHLLVYPDMPAAEVWDEASVVHAVACTLSVSARGVSDAEELLFQHAAQLREPRTIALVARGALAPDGFAAITQACADLAEISKDLAGNLTFILLTPDQPALGEVAQSSNWPPMTPQPDFLGFEDFFSAGGAGESRLVQRGFEIYLSLRCYWEANGAPEYLERLGSAHDRAGFWVSHDTPDARIWEVFDALIQPDSAHTARLSQVFARRVEAAGERSVFSTGLLQPESREGLKEALSCGLAWQPPGSYHVRVTPLAARALLDAPDFRTRWDLSDDQAHRFCIACRMNPLVASWVMSLSGLVEAEMLSFCKQLPALDDILGQIGMADELDARRRKGAQDLPPGYCAQLVDHASFGDLQHLIAQSAQREGFALTENRMSQVRRVRNLAAHRHPIRWPQVRVIIQALAALFARERRFRP